MNWIKKIVLNKLDEGSDRRGPMATLTLCKPNTSSRRESSYDLLVSTTALLSPHYKNVEETKKNGRHSEVNECWIFFRGDNTISINHKYWSEDQIEAWRQIVRTLAVLYGWEIEEEE